MIVFENFSNYPAIAPKHSGAASDKRDNFTRLSLNRMESGQSEALAKQHREHRDPGPSMTQGGVHGQRKNLSGQRVRHGEETHIG